MAGEKITRRNLPHWYRPDAAHFVTYRLAGTIPLAVLRKLRNQREAHRRAGPRAGGHTSKHRERIHKHFFAQYDRYLDHHRQIDWLATPSVAKMIHENLYFHDGVKYHLLAYCMMPNHVHVLFVPTDRSDKQPCLSNSELASADHKLPACGYGHGSPAAAGEHDERPFFSDEIPDGKGPLSHIMHSLKSYTANEANKLLSRSGQFWQHESYDHWVRDDDELERIVEYIAANPVNAGLVDSAEAWQYCSMHDRYTADGVASALLLPEILT